MSRRVKTILMIYLTLAVGMIVTSIVTGRRATAVAGTPHYLFTCTQIFVEAEVAAANETDAALDALFEEAGESTRLTVAKPIFVLGLLDATAPFVVVGALFVVLITLVERHHRRQALGKESADPL